MGNQIKSVNPMPKEITEAVKNYKIKISHIKAPNDYEYGKKAGAMYPGMMKKYYSMFPMVLKKLTIKIAHKMLLKIVLKRMGFPPVSPDHISILAKNYPAYFQRLKGFQESTGINLSELIFIGGVGCTNSASAPTATVGGEVFLTWNVDFSTRIKRMLTNIVSAPKISAPEVRGSPVLFLRDIEGHNKVFCLGVPGVLELPLLNDKGLAFVGNMLSVKDEGPGLSIVELLNKVMDQCSRVKKAADVMKNSPRFSSRSIAIANMNCLFADARGGIASIESTHRYFAVKCGRETGGVMAQGNHHQWLDFRVTGAPSKDRQPNGYKSSWIRTERMWKLLRQSAGKIDLETMMRFTADTANGPMPGKGGYDSICRYGPRDAEEKIPDAKPIYKEYSTLFAFVTQPKERIIWYCGGHPDEAPYLRIDVAKIFGELR